MQIDLNRFLFPAVNRATPALALGLAMAAGSANAGILQVLDSLIRTFEVALRLSDKDKRQDSSSSWAAAGYVSPSASYVGEQGQPR